MGSLEFTLKKRTNISFFILFCRFCLPGFFISAFWIIWDIGFCLPRFCLPGFFISDSWIIWDIGFRLPGLFGILVCGVGLL
ncbi:unnamed protein product [Rhizophagus irregularis]|nr:unnamed protein product [Rhizophagus irregularis]